MSTYINGRTKSTRNDITLLTEGDSSACPHRANQNLHSQLGPDNTGLMGITDRTGVLSTTNDDSHAIGSACRDGIFRRAAELDFSRNTNVNSKGTSELTGTSPSRLHLPVVSGPQKRWRVPASSEFEGPQQIHPGRTVQDGGVSHVEGSGETGRLVSKDRLEGCILPDASVFWVPDISAVHLEGKFLPVPFGLSCAPQVFMKVIKPVVAFLRERGIRLIIYLDDLLIIPSSP